MRAHIQRRQDHIPFDLRKKLLDTLELSHIGVNDDLKKGISWRRLRELDEKMKNCEGFRKVLNIGKWERKIETTH